MLKSIMRATGVAGSVSQSAQINGYSPDGLYIQCTGLPIFPLDGESIDLEGSIMDSDLGKIKLNVYLKNELGNDIQLVNNVPLAMFALMSDYNGASAYANSFDYAGTVQVGAFAQGKQIAIPLGDLVLQGDDSLTVTLTGSVASTAWGINMWAADDVCLTSEYLLSYSYVKGLDSQNFSFRNALELYSYGLTDSETTVKDYFNTSSVDYAGQIVKSLCEGRYEYTDGQHKAPYAKIWADFTLWSQDISFTTVSDLHYLCIGRAFAPERSVRTAKDIRNVQAFKASIIADDRDKAKVLGLI
jgi:hypothetical protein